MANKKKEYYKPGPMTEGKRNIIQGLLQEYNIESAADIQEALKDVAFAFKGDVLFSAIFLGNRAVHLRIGFESEALH